MQGLFAWWYDETCQNWSFKQRKTTRYLFICGKSCAPGSVRWSTESTWGHDVSDNGVWLVHLQYWLYCWTGIFVLCAYALPWNLAVPSPCICCHNCIVSWMISLNTFTFQQQQWLGAPQRMKLGCIDLQCFLLCSVVLLVVVVVIPKLKYFLYKMASSHKVARIDVSDITRWVLCSSRSFRRVCMLEFVQER